MGRLILVCSTIWTIAVASGCGGGDATPVARTVATVEPIRGELAIDGEGSRPRARIEPGAALVVSDPGVSRLRLDGGSELLLGHGASLTVHDATEIELTAGRIFVTAGGGERLRLRTPRGALGTTDASFSARLVDGQVAVYVVSGELGFGAGADHGVARAGEELLLSDGDDPATVAPAEVWADWTGGLARPAVGDVGNPAGMGSLEARVPGELGTARRPLVVRTLDVRVEIRGDLAVTEIDQVFHNPGAETVEGLYRFRAPQGAVVQRFAIDRNGQLVEAFVRERQQAQASYQAQVYRGSTDDPALLVWDAPGSYHARIYPIGPDQRRRIVVRYAEWLGRSDADAPRLYRYPMGGGSRPPYIEEFELTMDLSEADASSIRAGMGATVSDTTVQLRRSDFRPAADFWLELRDREPSTALRAFRAHHSQPRRAPGSNAPEGEEDERDYVLIPLVLPAGLAGDQPQENLDLVVVADVSAATDPSHLELAQSVVEALATHLGPDDRIAVVASDLTLRSVIEGEGGEQLGAASPERLEQLLDGLARVASGGATDLGTAITAAGDLLDPTRRGAVVYVGDGAPTVGELQTADLLERIARLPSAARLYGVAVGADANLDLLGALTRGRGLAARIEERRAAAETALDILAHASRPMARQISLELGSQVEGLYPSGPADVVLGDVLPVIGRIERGDDLPDTIRVSGTIAGRDFEESLDVDVQTVEDSGDLRLRWAGERLRHLLIEGVPRETIVELGTRYGLITPYTSYYVPSARELRSGGYSSLDYDTLDLEGGRNSADALPLLAAVITAPLGIMGCGLESEAPQEELAASPALQQPAYEQLARGVSGSATPAPIAASEELAEPPSPSAPSLERGASSTVDLPTAQPAPASASPGVGSVSGMGAGGGGALARNEPSSADGVISNIDNLGAAGGEAQQRARRSSKSLGGFQAAKSTARPRRRPRSGRADDASGEADRRAALRTLVPDNADGDDEESTEAEPEEANEQQERWHSVRDGEGEGRSAGRTATKGRDLHQALQCSEASALPLSDRSTLWRERLGAQNNPDAWARVYRQAIRDCEAQSWRDRRALLNEILRRGNIPSLLRVYQLIGRGGAGPYLRRAILTRVRTPADLAPVRRAFGGSANVDWDAIEDRLLTTAADGRVTMLRELVAQHPGSFDLRLRLLASLEAADRVPEALRMAQDLRHDTLADAEVRTAVGELLLRHDQESEARRVFSEMVEFAPYDALARRRLGDLYRAHGWYDDAYRQYQTLAELRPDDQLVNLLLAAAAAGAGRVDEALRLEQRLAESPEPGGTGGLARVATIISSTRLAKLRRIARAENDDDRLTSLMARMRRSAVLRAAGDLRVTLIWAHPHAGLSLWGSRPGHTLTRPQDVWPELGVEAFEAEDLERGAYTIEVRRSANDLATPAEAELVIIWNEGETDERIEVVPIRLEGSETALAWTIEGTTLAETQPMAASLGEVL